MPRHILEPATLDEIGGDLDTVRALLNSTPTVGQSILRRRYPTISDSARNDLMQLCPEPSDSYIADMSEHRLRQKFLAAAWLCGGSWSQLGMMYGVRRESVRASAQKVLIPAYPRLAKRVAYTRLEEFKVTFDSTDPDWIMGASPSEIAKLLLETDSLEEEGATYGEA